MFSLDPAVDAKLEHSLVSRSVLNVRRVLRSDLELAPLDAVRDEPDLTPVSTAWTAVPGLPGVRWRASNETFDAGTKGPLYYDVAIALPD